MELGITKEKAKDLLDEYVKDPIIKLHMIESEAIMRALAEKFYKEFIFRISFVLYKIKQSLKSPLPLYEKHNFEKNSIYPQPFG